MSDSIGIQVGLGLIKSIVCVYDVITFPFYFFAQKPWEVKAKASEIQAKQNQPNNPYSAWARVSQPESRFYDDCKTVSEFFSRVVKEYGDKKSFGTRQVFGEEDEKQPDGKVFRKFILGDYQWVSSYEVDKRIENFGKGLLTNGVHPRDNVLIFAETRFEWMLAAQAIFRIGATVATLYPTLGEDGIVHGINETEVTHIITTHDLLPKLQKLMDRIPLVRYIIYMEGLKSPKTNGFDPKVNVMSFSQIEKSGMNAGDVRGEPPQPNTTAVLMYTSGSTGIPKGVMITHKNLLKAITAFSVIKHVLSDKDIYMGFLPLAHVLELAAELFFFSCGVAIGYATPLTLTDKSTGIKKGCPGDAVLLKPTVMAAVPLILDRIRKGVIEQVEQKGKFFSALFNFAIDYKKFWKRKGFRTPVVNALICKRIKAMLGGRVRVIAVGSAPLSPETHDFIAACLDITLLQGYGLTETTASACLMDYYDLSLGRVGPPLEGIQIKLTDWAEGGYRVTDKPYPRGEIVVGGENITAGYYKNDTLTKESYKEEDGIRWFYTGDIGEAHPDGSFKIIDRKKDLVKLQFGEYISLGKVEAELKSCSYVDNICIYGDSFRSYLIGLVVPNAKALKMLAEQLGKEHLSHNELCRDKQIISAITKSITEHGIKAKLHKNEIPTKIKICPEEWVPDTGLVTAAFKLRRKNIEDFYKLDIDRLYGVENGISKST